MIRLYSQIKFNALKTGLYARTVVLPDEDQPYYESLGAGLCADYQPQSDIERELILTIQNTMWRLNRVVELEGNRKTPLALHAGESQRKK